MSYTQVFGGTTIYPSDVSYLALALSADKALEWPLESNDPTNPAARIIDVTTTGSYSITLPDATQTGAGQTILFNNLSASTNSFTLKDYGGSTIATVGIGEQWQVYLSDTSTAAGTWRVFRYGASTATVQASALAGYGITVTSNTLSQSTPITTFNSSPRTVLVTERAGMLIWTGTGAATVNLPSAATAGNNFFVSVRNSGGGDVSLDPAGSETIDDLTTLALRPGDSATLVTDGLTWYTLGLGQEAVFAFDYTSITVTGGTYTLAGSELNRIAYKFVGTLGSDQYIVVPSTVQQYWVDNATTGSYSFYLQTSGGTPISVAQGARGIFYCNGSQVVDADTATISLPISAANGGTGITSYAIGDLIYASGATTLSKLADVAVGNALISGGVGVAPSWGKIVLTTHVSGTLPAANGGTGQSSYAVGDLIYASGATTLSKLADVATGNALISGGVGVAPSWGKIGLTTHISGTLAVGNGGTGATTLTGVVIGNGASAFTTVTAPSGAIVGTTDTQNLSGKTLTTGNTIDAGTSISDTGTIAATSPGFRGIPQNAKTASYTLALTDAGKHISITTGGVIIPANGSVAFPIGTTIVIYNDSGTSQNITITTDTLRQAGTTNTGTRTLAGYGLATCVKVGSTTWVISGAGVG